MNALHLLWVQFFLGFCVWVQPRTRKEIAEDFDFEFVLVCFLYMYIYIYIFFLIFSTWVSAATAQRCALTCPLCLSRSARRFYLFFSLSLLLFFLIELRFGLGGSLWYATRCDSVFDLELDSVGASSSSWSSSLIGTYSDADDYYDIVAAAAAAACVPTYFHFIFFCFFFVVYPIKLLKCLQQVVTIAIDIHAQLSLAFWNRANL